MVYYIIFLFFQYLENNKKININKIKIFVNLQIISQLLKIVYYKNNDERE